MAGEYINRNAGNLFSSTFAEYVERFINRNVNGSLSPEQLALPGHTPHPQIGFAAGAGLGLVVLGAVAPTDAAAWGAGTVLDFAGDAISHGLGLTTKTADFGKSFTVGGIAGLTSPLMLPFNTLGSSMTGHVFMGGYNASVSGVGAFGANAIVGGESNPPLAGGLGFGGAALGSILPTLVPTQAREPLKYLFQIVPGPLQAVVENSRISMGDKE